MGGVTVQVSVYEVPATLDPDPDSVTSGGSTTAVQSIMCIYIASYIMYIYNILGSTGPTTLLGRCTTATIEMLWTPPIGSVSRYVLTPLETDTSCLTLSPAYS